MDWLWWLIGIVVGLFAIDRLFLWFEKKGWLYWRKTKRKGGGMAAGLMTMNAVFDPSAHHAAEAREERQMEEDEDGDDDDKRKPEDQVS